MRLNSLLSLMLIVFELGCGSPNVQTSPGGDAQLRLLGRLYGQYMADHNGQGPVDEMQLVAYLEKSADFLKSQGIAVPRDLLKSPRDGQPLSVVYGKQVVVDENTGFPWVAWESQGLDGKRYIIGARGNIDEMTKEQIEAMVAH
jgi:hypothetical protein